MVVYVFIYFTIDTYLVFTNWTWVQELELVLHMSLLVPPQRKFKVCGILKNQIP